MRRIVLCFFCLSYFTGLAQNGDIDLEQFAERLFQVQDEDINYEDIYESLLIYSTNPIDLNKTDREELSSLYILSPFQLNNFFNHLSKNGKLLSLYELQTIEGFDLELIRGMLPFVSVDESKDARSLLQRIAEEPNNYLLLRYTAIAEEQRGFTEENGFRGDPGTIYGRYRVSKSRDFSLGFTFEKDAGEQIRWQSEDEQKGFDYYSGHLFFQNKGIFKSIALGDFQIQFGQGLVFGAGFGAGKGSETVNSVKRNSTGIRPYASVLESGFFRGGGVTIGQGKLSTSFFYSNLDQDGNLLTDTTYSDFEEFVNSIQATGLHRTDQELANKNKINEQSTGGAMTFAFNPRFKIGVTGLYTHYSSPIQKKPNNYNQFEFNGDQNYLGGLFANYGWQNFILFGEVAQSKSGGIGAVGGWMASLSSIVDMSMVFRNYDKDFHSFYGNAFGESSRIINEQGVYWGLKIHPSKKYTLAVYYDKFNFPWLRFGAEAPSEGFEYLGRFTYRPSRSITMFVQLRQENRQRDFLIEGANLNTLVEGIKKNYLFNIDFKLGRNLSIRSRLQTSTYQQADEFSKGFALIQDLNYSFWKIKLSGRAAIFDTEDFENRQYVYEKDVLYAFSIPAYNGNGQRSYVMAQYNLSRKLTFWVRFARFTFRNVESVGSGLTEIEGNRRTDLKFMMRLKF